MQLPGPVRALVGLLAATAEEARHLPDRAVELPMLAVSSALQASLRAQQRYARLAARGDDVLNRRPPSTEPPAWATFDDPVSADELRAAGLADSDPALRARAASQLLDELLGVTNDTAAAPGRDAAPAKRTAPANNAAKPAPAKKATAPATKKTTAPATKKTTAAAKKQPAKKASAAKKTTAAAKKAGAAKQTSTARTGKSISAPRHTSPSRFDTVGDE
jgi:hypothetical protein